MNNKSNNNSYYAVIFTNTLGPNTEGYIEMATQMEDLAKEQPGYLDFESARSDIGISISYWQDLESINAWKENLAHLIAQKKGVEEWYQWYKVRICKVERAYEFKRP